MFGILSQITKKTINKTAAAVPDIAAKSKAAFSANLAELEKFAAKDLPSVVNSQKAAMAGLEQLSKNVQAMIKQ